MIIIVAESDHDGLPGQWVPGGATTPAAMLQADCPSRSIEAESVQYRHNWKSGGGCWSESALPPHKGEVAPIADI